MTDKSKVATVVLAGLAAGAAAWYLLATDDGKATCSKLMGSFKDLSGKFNDLKDRAADTIDQITGQAGKMADNFKQASTAYENS